MTDPYIVSVNKHAQGQSYIVHMSDGDVIVIDYGYTLSGDVNFLFDADAEDGTNDGQVDLIALEAEILAGRTNDGFAVFRSSSGQDFTVTAGLGGGNSGDSYMINMADGSVIIVAGRSLAQLDVEK